jgi:hypothetical protein
VCVKSGEGCVAWMEREGNCRGWIESCSFGREAGSGRENQDWNVLMEMVWCGRWKQPALATIGSKRNSEKQVDVWRRETWAPSMAGPAHAGLGWPLCCRWLCTLSDLRFWYFAPQYWHSSGTGVMARLRLKRSGGWGVAIAMRVCQRSRSQPGRLPEPASYLSSTAHRQERKVLCYCAPSLR